MKAFKIRSSSDQLADFLREEILGGRWGSEMPGETWLVSNLRVGREIVRSALKQLEKEGLVVSRGGGKKRLIERSHEDAPRNFRITLLLYSPSGLHKEDAQRLLRRLGEMGYQVGVAPKTLMDLKMDVGRVSKFAGGYRTDAWVVFSGSHDVLEWFADQPVPAFALFGRFPAVPMARTGPGRFPAYQEAIRRLVALGHRKIVLVLSDSMRKPTPSKLLQQILGELDGHGIPTGEYTHPDWQQTPDGLQQCIDKLFRVTPPTALFVDQPRELHAVQQSLAMRGVLAPRDISLICTDHHSDFEWSRPMISHFDWSIRSCINRVERWVANVSRGKEDRRGGYVATKFIEGGTIGQAPRPR